VDQGDSESLSQLGGMNSSMSAMAIYRQFTKLRVLRVDDSGSSPAGSPTNMYYIDI